MKISYKPSKWGKLSYISKFGLIIFYLGISSGFLVCLLDVSKIITLPDYWLFLSVVIAFLGFLVAAIFDKEGKVEIGVDRE